jgi:predicted SAM-dependent methyltransferase
MNRVEKLLVGLDLGKSVGAEIGPLAWPIVRKSQGHVLYIDYLDQAGLRKKYEDHTNVPKDDIVPIDIVAASSTAAAAALKERGGVDYVMASHVLEHVPDLVGWLQDLSDSLRPGGTIRLALPEYRFCFDFLREPSRLSDVLTAHIAGAVKPQMREIVDFALHRREVTSMTNLWDGTHERRPVDADDFARARNAALFGASGEYVDVHCWTLTLGIFAQVMADLCRMGLVRLQCVRGFDAEVYEHEFVVVMSLAEPQEALESWNAVVKETSGPESDDVLNWPEARQRWMERTRSEAMGLRRQLEDMRRSTSWRITAPLRRLREMMRKR